MRFFSKIFKPDEKGFILVLTMLMALLGLALSGAMLFMATISSRMSGAYQRYTNVLDAAKGTSDLTMNLLRNYTFTNSINPDYGTPNTPACLSTKLSTPTCAATPVTGIPCPGGTTYYQWQVTCGPMSAATSTDASSSPDISTQFLDARTNALSYLVYTKIINTQSIAGQAGAQLGCDCTACTFCNVYTVLIRSQKNANPSETGIISFVYATYDGNNND
ncbi:MAG: hypothetical protein HQK89_13010 [Nitrospirae bacterium]|nr:hypothetical protein [Nitrospirota bacterium]